MSGPDERDEAGGGATGNRPGDFLAAIKRMLVLSKDNFDLLLKLAPLALLPSAAILWWHLKTIHWSDVFLESAISAPGLTFLVVAALALWLLSVALFLVPSIPIIGATEIAYGGRALPGVSVRASFAALAGWVLVVVPSVDYQFSQWWFLLVPFVCALIAVVVEHLRRPAPWSRKGRYWATVRNVVQIAGVTVAMVVTSMPLAVVLRSVANLPDFEETPSSVKLLLALLVSLIGLIPGYVYVAARRRHANTRVPNKAALAGTLLVAYFVIAFALAVLPVGAIVLKAADVYSNDRFTFQILKEDLVGAMIKAGLPVENDKDMRIVSGYVRYHFGGMRLLCRDPFDPASVSAAAVRAAREAGKPDPGRVGGAHCVTTATADLRKFTVENGVEPPG